MAAKNLYGSPHVARLPLSPVERELVGTVLEDCVDHLAVLGGIMPNYTEKASAVDNVSFPFNNRASCRGLVF